MLQKLLLTSVLIATIAIPLRAARDRSERRGLRRTVRNMILFTVFYLLALMHIYPRL